MGLKAALIIYAVLFASAASAETRWLMKSVGFCKAPSLDYRQCRPLLPSEGPFRVLGITTNLGDKFYKLSVNGEIGYSDALFFEKNAVTEDPKIIRERERKASESAAAKRRSEHAAAVEECERRGQPKIGMTPAELIETCWRKPRRIVKKTTAAGVEENYIYGIGHIVKIVDGKVTEIVEAR